METAVPGVKFSGGVTVSLAAGAKEDSVPVGVALVSGAIMSGVTVASAAGAAASAVGVDAPAQLTLAGAGSAIGCIAVWAAVGVVVSGCAEAWESTEAALLFVVASGLSPVLRLARFSADIVSPCVLLESKLWLMIGAAPFAALSLLQEGFAPIH